MDTSEAQEMLKQAMAAVNAGDTVQGRALIENVLESDPHNDLAWVWLSGCVEDPIQRRICLQQALKANPQNPAALDGMRVLDGELVPATSFAPTLLESRLAAIGMGDRGADAPSSAPAPAADYSASPTLAEAAAPAREASPADAVQAAPQRRRRGLLILVLLAVFLLAVFVCGLVVWQVVLPMLGESIM